MPNVSFPQRPSLSALLTLFLLAILSLPSCAGLPKSRVTNGHLHDLKPIFVGRQIQFLTDWHAYSVIYQGRSAHWYDMFYYKTGQVQHGLVKRGEYLAHKGDQATITDVQIWTYHTMGVYFKNRNGKLGVIRIGTPNRKVFASEYWEELTDQTATAQWIEKQLTTETIAFIDQEAPQLSSPQSPDLQIPEKTKSQHIEQLSSPERSDDYFLDEDSWEIF